MVLTQFLKGLVIILIGVILLLNNLNIMEWSVWSDILKLWPLLLVSLGISLIFKRRFSWLGPLVILVGIILGVSSNYMGIDLQLESQIAKEVTTIQREIEMTPQVIPKIEQEATIKESQEETSELLIESEEKEDKEISEPEENKIISEDIAMVYQIQKVNLHLNYTVGSFSLKSPTNLLYQCQVSYRYPEFKPKEDFSIQDDVAKILITHHPVSEKMARNPKNDIDLKLNSDIVYEIFQETGATSIDYDLSKFKIENLSIKSGASKIKLVAPQYNGKINIDSGVSLIDIAIPNNVGTRLYLDTGLSIKNLSEHFQKQEDKVYISRDYEKATYQLDIKIDSGISQINIYYL